MIYEQNEKRTSHSLANYLIYKSVDKYFHSNFPTKEEHRQRSCLRLCVKTLCEKLYKNTKIIKNVPEVINLRVKG